MQINMTDSLWKSLLSEFMGTFTVVFIGTSSIALGVNNSSFTLSTAIAFGLALVAVIYVWGSFSGAHVNPAVSLGFAVSGQMNWLLTIGYWLAQFSGAIAAAALAGYFFDNTINSVASVGTTTLTDTWKTIFMEALLTFFLVVTYLFLYRNPFDALINGLIIGIVLTVCMLAGSTLTGASLNPARSLGNAIFGQTLNSYWLYLVGPLIGALVAALVYKVFTCDFGTYYLKDDCGKNLLDECGNKIKVYKKPLVDSCGKVMKDDCGNKIFETFAKKDYKLGYVQETVGGVVGEWLKAPHLDQKQLSEELTQEVKEVLENVQPEPLKSPMKSPRRSTRKSVKSSNSFELKSIPTPLGLGTPLAI